MVLSKHPDVLETKLARAKVSLLIHQLQGTAEVAKGPKEKPEPTTKQKPKEEAPIETARRLFLELGITKRAERIGRMIENP